MTKKNILVAVALVLAVGGFYLYLYRDSFRKPVIQVFHTIRPRAGAFRRRPPAAANDAPAKVITLGMRFQYKLTSVKVVPLAEYKTNKFVHALWHLVSDSNSVPTQFFTYGAQIKGMHPDIQGTSPDPLVTNVPYRLLIQAGTVKGEHDFTVTSEDDVVK
jgi:hypothetical protein